MRISILSAAALYTLVDGHGNMVFPPTWFDPKGVQTEAGMTCGTAVKPTKAFAKRLEKMLEQPGYELPSDIPDATYEVASCLFFMNDTTIGDEQLTLPLGLITYPATFSNHLGNPWMAPGTATFKDGSFSVCGVAGGNPKGCPEGKPGNGDVVDCPAGGFSYGFDAMELEYPDAQTTVWKAGDIVEAAFGLNANHGGGYSYRLCSMNDDLTEECFQAGALDFAGQKQWAQFGNDESTRVAWDIQKFSTPNGNEWAKVPVPACGGDDGGAFTTLDMQRSCKSKKGCRCNKKLGTQFAPPAPGIEGFGTNGNPANPPQYLERAIFQFHIVDKLQVPEDLAPGKYALSWRWDCEQTAQVWTTCANIEIVAGGAQAELKEAAQELKEAADELKAAIEEMHPPMTSAGQAPSHQ